MSDSPVDAEDWVDLSEAALADPPPVAAERVPQPLWYFPPRDEWPGRLWRGCRRAARKAVPLLASVAAHAAVVCLAAVAGTTMFVSGRSSGPPDGAGETIGPAAGGATEAGNSPTSDEYLPAGCMLVDPLREALWQSDREPEELPRVDAAPLPVPLAESIPKLSSVQGEGGPAQTVGITPGPAAGGLQIGYASDGHAFGMGRWVLIHDAGDAPPAAARGGTGAGPTARPTRPEGGRPPAGALAGMFFGPDAPASARRITFACDVSGSMISKFASLKDELSKAVNRLSPDQSFNVVFFQSNDCLAFDRRGFAPATAENKRRAYRFFDNASTTGPSDPDPGLAFAIGQSPDLLYLVTDGDFPDNAAVLKRVRALNAKKSVRIDTIAFVNDKDTDHDFIQVLETIASESGGAFHYVNEMDLNP